MRPENQSPDRKANLVDQLAEKYASSGQDLNSYLEGLLYTEYLSYWDYIHLDTLLTLQVPRTAFPDEEIFIMYHQITELYFKLILLEMKQICDGEQTEANWLKRIGRMNRYMDSLIKSFDVMVDGMDPDQFMKFRMSLLPASGFQSVQFRLIEIISTKLERLTNEPDKDWSGKPTKELIDNFYWLQGATELATGKQTLTLRRFVDKYGRLMVITADDYKYSNLYSRLLELSAQAPISEELKVALREFDAKFNINWRLMHLKSAVRYLQKEPEVIAATGGTNWQKYLPPRFQQRIFFPNLWSDQEQSEWGHAWFRSLLAGQV